MSVPLATWRRVVAPDSAGLRAAAAAATPGDAAAIARMRRRWDADAVRLALQLAEARARADRKFPGLAAELVADPDGLEQASSLAVARLKAQRFEAAGAKSVIDLCCGIGGDAMGLRAAGLDPLTVDLDPVRAWMAGLNARCATVVADAATVDVHGRFVHIDPARRDAGRRLYRLSDHRPGPPVIGPLLARARGGAVKLSPGVDLVDLADSLPDGEVQFISEAGRLVQAVLWTGELAGDRRTATRLDGDRVVTLTGAAVETDDRTPPDRFVCTVDPAVERAGLIGLLAGELGLGVVHPKLGLLTGPDLPRSPWLTCFELIERMPWRPRRVRRWLADRDAGLVEVKTRGKAVDPDRAQQELRGDGTVPYAVFVLRFDRQVTALITRRIA